MLISVHIPKTAGSSFRGWLASAYGADAVLWDYADRPLDPASPMNVDPAAFLQHAWSNPPRAGVEVVHGHFWAKKYDPCKAARIAFLRDPVERSLSHFFYWKNRPSNGHGLHDLVRQPGFGFADFVRLYQFRTFYTGVFFVDVDMASFDFIGDHARYETELSRLEGVLGRTGERQARNLNPEPAYAEQKQQILGDARLLAEITDLLADEVRFYETHAGR